MRESILLFESRDLCYESNRYFMECLKEAFEHLGYSVELCDLSVQMEEKLERILARQEQYLFAMDFNSLLPRIQLEDGTPYLAAFRVPFLNYLVDHPLYHHFGLKNDFSHYFVICIDKCHQAYVKRYYPHIRDVFYLPLGAMQAGMERGFDQKRLELLFLGTYEPEDALYRELEEYPDAQRSEVAALIEMMEADGALTQEDALMRYLKEHSVQLSEQEFAQRLNRDYLADKYLRNVKRKEAVLAAMEAEVPFTVMGHGWEVLDGFWKKHVTLRKGVGFAASLQMMANAKMLLNTTPAFHRGFHDRVYSAMRNKTVCFTEENAFAREMRMDGWEAVLYDGKEQKRLAEQIALLHEDEAKRREIAERAFQKVCRFDTWEKRAEALLEMLHPHLWGQEEKQEKEFCNGKDI